MKFDCTDALLDNAVLCAFQHNRQLLNDCIIRLLTAHDAHHTHHNRRKAPRWLQLAVALATFIMDGCRASTAVLLADTDRVYLAMKYHAAGVLPLMIPPLTAGRIYTEGQAL